MSPAGGRSGQGSGKGSGKGRPSGGFGGSGSGSGRSGGAGRPGANSGGRAGGAGGKAGGAGGIGRSGAGRPLGPPGSSGGGGRSGGRSAAGPARSGSARSGSGGGGSRSGGSASMDRLPWERPMAPKGLDGAQVEGRQAVRELLAAGRRRVRTLIMAEGTDDSPILVDIEELAAARGIPVRRVSKEQVLAQARTESPQGVIAHAEPLEEADPDEMLERRPHGMAQPFILALDGLTDPGNLGALLRSAEGAGVTGVVVPKHRAVHITPTVAKAAAGAIEHLPIGLVPGLPAYLLRAKERGAWVVGLDAGSTTTVHDLAHLADQPLIVVVGAEGDGLSRLVRERCDVIAAIALRGRIESLNASVAGAVALFEIGRHRPVDGPYGSEEVPLAGEDDYDNDYGDDEQDDDEQD